MLKKRREAAIEFLGLSIFVDREHGKQVATKVLATMPMPEIGGYAPLSLPVLGKRSNKRKP